MKIIKHSHHRNGISGHPFTVAIIEDEDGSRKVLVRLDKQADKDTGLVCCCVLDIDLLAGGDIGFGSNSWRGDHYAECLDGIAPDLQAFGPMIFGDVKICDPPLTQPKGGRTA